MTIGSLSCTLLGSRPPGRLARYAAAFPTAEFNSSFYRWPRPSAFRHWRQKLPDGFRPSVKAPRGFSLRVAVRGRATCRVLGIDVRHTAARQAVSQHDAVTTDYELTDAGLVAACAGFDD